MSKADSGDEEDEEGTTTIRAEVSNNTYEILLQEKVRRGLTWKGLLRDYAHEVQNEN